MIKFPKVNIATSVVNRILNAADDIPSLMGAPSVPNVPDSGPLGETIDETIVAPMGPLAPTDPALTDDLVTGSLFP
jgi:hypothetical protein